MKKVIKVNLFNGDISEVRKSIDEYKKWLTERTQFFVKRLAEMGVEIETIKFSDAQYDGTNDVTVSMREDGVYTASVVADGNAVLFIEFGTGVVYPNTHPENPYTRGGYGYGLGKFEKGWRYSGDPGTNGEVISKGKHAGEVHTFGNPSNNCAYNTRKELERVFKDVAKECYGD